MQVTWGGTKILYASNYGDTPYEGASDVYLLDPGPAPAEIFADGFESGGTLAWSAVGPARAPS